MSRLAPELPFPAYAYVPGRHRHPARAGARHTPDGGAPGTTQLYALDLFNHGYYWEAHEAWEALWHELARHGPEGRLLRALIALAAAGVKAREGNARGVVRHLGRAAALLRDLGAERPVVLGLNVAEIAAFAESVAAAPPCRPAEPGAAPQIVFPARLTPG